MTDADGVVTFFNRACVDFAGRTPLAGQDRWCVTWRLYTEAGALLAHADCPLAIAIKEKRPVRNVVAVAERPDGTRSLFMPFATPVLDDDGELVGAVNLLLDVTDERQAELLKAQASRCRRLAQTVTDQQTVATLNQMAEEYEGRASEIAREANAVMTSPLLNAV